MPDVFALLVGINDYTPNVGQLYGCLNDVDAYTQYLSDRYSKSCHIQTLKDSQATRQGIVEGFRKHLSQAGPDDIVVFQFSGHGARWKAAPEFNQYYPDGYDEGLVCWDSRRDPDNQEKFDLADKELGVLVSEVASEGQHVVVILDCCHSGSGTRSADEFQGLKSRMTHQVDTPRGLDSYLEGFYASQLSNGKQLWTPTSRHILLAACERRKQAFEAKDRRGIFSTTLINTLNEYGGKITYSDLFLRTRAKVRRSAMNQTPQFEAYMGFNGNSGFLRSDVSSGTGAKRFYVNFELEHSAWTVECGALQGMQAKPQQLPELTLYEDGSDQAVGTAKPSQIGLSKSQIELDFESNKAKTYHAEITSLPAAPMTVGVTGDDDATRQLIQLQQAEGRWSGIQLIKDDQLSFDYTVYAEDIDGEGPCLAIKETSTGELVRGIRTYSEKACESILKFLDQIAFWQRMLRLQNEQDLGARKRIPFDFVQVSDEGHDVRFEQPEVRFELEGDGSEIVTGKLVTRNNTGQLLYSMVLYFSDRFGLRVLDNDEFPSADSERTILLNGDPELEMFLDTEDPQKSIERFMLVVSSQPIDDFLIEPAYQPDRSSEDPHQILDDIDWGAITDPLRGRGVRTGKQKIRKIQWFTKTIQVELLKRSGKIANDQPIQVHDKIRIAPHPGLQGDVTIGNVQANGRSVESPDQFCRALEGSGLSLCNFSSARDQSVSVLEFSNLKNVESLDEHPLQIDLDLSLSENESVLPIVFDGTAVHLVGDSVATDKGSRVTVYDLPKPTNQRSLLGTVKLYLFKNFLKMDLSGIRYARLADATTGLQTQDLAAHVANAKQILLLIPGMFSDGNMLLEFIRNRGLPRGDKQLIDDPLVLAFDYEKLNTTFEDTAKLLKQKLSELGVSSVGKHIAILAHGSGSIVARWLVEQESGKDYVDRLTMLGGPHLGSPLGHIKYAKKAIRFLTGAALNFMPTAAAIGGMILGSIVKLDNLTKALDQLGPNSNLIKTLNQSADPGVPYVLLAGDAKMMKGSEDWSSTILKRIQSSPITSMMFQGDANDLFVSVPSAQFLPSGRTPEPTIELASTHHFGLIHQQDYSDETLKLFE